jgi:hypothetical protein
MPKIQMFSHIQIEPQLNIMQCDGLKFHIKGNDKLAIDIEHLLYKIDRQERSTVLLIFCKQVHHHRRMLGSC